MSCAKRRGVTAPGWLDSSDVYLIMPPRSWWGLGRPPFGVRWAVSADQPLGVVGLDEAGHGLAELVDAVVQVDPQALLFAGADPSLGAAACPRLAQERGVVADAQPGDRAQEVAGAILRPPLVPQQQAAGHVRSRGCHRSMSAS